jgi:MYXO-CTERM domain-containing protein
VYTACEEEQVETCEEECDTTGGAIFCDGNFLHASNLRACADELAAKIDIHLDVDVMVDVDVDVDVSKKPRAPSEDEDADEDGLDAACSVTSVALPRGSHAFLGFLGFVAFAMLRRRRSVMPPS